MWKTFFDVIVQVADILGNGDVRDFYERGDEMLAIFCDVRFQVTGTLMNEND